MTGVILNGVTPAIYLPPGLAIGIIAFLLSLLPATLFIWLWYLRRSDRPVPATLVAGAFAAGLVLVWPAFRAEKWLSQLWHQLSPATSHYFVGAITPLRSPLDIVLPAVGAFLMVAMVEEGLRYVLLRLWIVRSKSIDQVFDGLVVGIAAGLGFATLENTLYFLNLFTAGSYDTLVFVFFLRFLVSTLAHVSFGGLMGAWLARAALDLWRPRKFYFLAFVIPWFLHGLYDLLLGVNLAAYAVLMMVPTLMVLASWTTRRDFFAVARKEGRLLAQQEAPDMPKARLIRRLFKRFESPWNVHAPWLRERRLRYTFLRELKKEERL